MKNDVPLKKTINKELVLYPYGQNENLPYKLDFNNDGILDIEITGETSLSGSNGSKNGLYIQGLNGTRICFETKKDTSWMKDVFNGTNDTIFSYNTFKQPTPFNLGDEINTQLTSSDSLLTIFYERNFSSMNIPQSDIHRTSLISSDFKYFGVITPGGLYWIKIKPGIPISFIESCSNIGANSSLIIQE